MAGRNIYAVNFKMAEEIADLEGLKVLGELVGALEWNKKLRK